MKYRLIVLLMISGLSFAASAGLGSPVAPEPIPLKESTPLWDGPQFVQADRAGNIFFLRGNTLDVYSLGKAGGFGKPVRLQSLDDNGGFVHGAVLNSAGDQWLVYVDF